MSRILAVPSATAMLAHLARHGPAPVAALELIFPGAARLAARTGTDFIIPRQCGTERGLAVHPDFALTWHNCGPRQVAYAWLCCRTYESGCTLTPIGITWTLSYPRGHLDQVSIFPDRPLGNGGLVIVPDGYNPDAHSTATVITVVQLRQHTLRQLVDPQKKRSD